MSLNNIVDVNNLHHIPFHFVFRDQLTMKVPLLVLFNFLITQLNADVKKHDGLSTLINNGKNYNISGPESCTAVLEAFAQSASDLSFCSIRYSRPIRLCENCITEYVNFYKKYQELSTMVINGTSCQSVFMSQDRLNVVMDYHDNIVAVWNKGNCNTCYDWNGLTPTLKNDTHTFNKMHEDTTNCISSGSTNVCEKCFDLYVELDTFYKSLSSDAIGVDSICMDIVDSMNATRSIWSKKLNCCNLRRTPEIAFLCCASIISVLPLVYYLTVRFCRPIRDLPNVLKQSRFKQSILRESDAINN